MAGFRHIVLLTCADGTTDAHVDEIVAAVGTLPDAIPEITSYVVGVDARLSDGNATIGIVADFASRDDYQIYADHPVHQRVIAESIRPYLAARTAVQHETP